MARTLRKVATWVKNCFFSEHNEENKRELKQIDRKHQTAIVNDGKAHGQFFDAVRTQEAKKFAKRSKHRSDRIVAKDQCKPEE